MVLMERRQIIDQGWLGPNNPGSTLTIEEALLRQRYIHYSAHYAIAGPLFPFKPAPGDVRAIYPNRGLK